MKKTQIAIGTQDELFDATKKNDMDLVSELLSRSCSPNHTDQVLYSFFTILTSHVKVYFFIEFLDPVTFYLLL